MLLEEFNNLSRVDKHCFIFNQPLINISRFISFRKEGEMTISLWNCDSFFAEIHYSRQLKRVLKVEGINLYDDKINLYIDYYLQHRKSEESYLVEIG
jgi:hypothetical protein